MSVLSRALRPAELVRASSLWSGPRVFEPTTAAAASLDSFFGYLKDNQDELKSALDESGCLLFRGFDVREPMHFNDAMAAMGHEAGDYRFGITARSHVAGDVYVSSEAPPFQFVLPHIELANARRRCGVISFCSMVDTPVAGETPIGHHGIMVDNMRDSVRQKFESSTMTDRMRCHKEHSLLRLYVLLQYAMSTKPKVWPEVFGTSSKEEAEAMCREAGIRYSWLDNDVFEFVSETAPLVVHPRTGKTALNLSLNFYTDVFHREFLKAFPERYLPIQRQILDLMWRFRFGIDAADPNWSRAQFTDPSVRLTEEEFKHIVQLELDTLYLYSWQRGDILVVDNITCSHARMNVVQPRRILAWLGNMYDARKLPSPVQYAYSDA